MNIIEENLTQNYDSYPIALVVSEFNGRITSELCEGAFNRLRELNIKEDDILVVKVPGAVEIPMAALRLAQKNHFKAIIALGSVIRGQTNHYDYVCEQVNLGCLKVSLKHSVPVIFGVLTTENEAQAWERLGGRFGHTGVYSAEAALKMIKVLGAI